ncbi:Hypothetical_protein [Hexamita inflata]|uniref:Hypothetical_protein n=1 Tax=Hexamita inflata TaxID=28002 RepID=A0AA86N8G4_9EUKA|nr:Hypothetical protein HINF_LOCUS2318 [Hexamita inflata]
MSSKLLFMQITLNCYQFQYSNKSHYKHEKFSYHIQYLTTLKNNRVGTINNTTYTKCAKSIKTTEKYCDVILHQSKYHIGLPIHRAKNVPMRSGLLSPIPLVLSRIVLTQHPKSPFPHAQLRAILAHNMCLYTHAIKYHRQMAEYFLLLNNQSSDSICLFNLLLQCLLILLIYQFLIHDPVIMAPHGASSDSNYPVNMTAAQLLI